MQIAAAQMSMTENIDENFRKSIELLKTAKVSFLIDSDGSVIGSQKMVHIAQVEKFYEQSYYTPSEEGFDVVADAFGAWAPEVLPQHSTSLKHLCDILSGTDIRLVVVGGAGSLYVNPEHTAQVMDGPDFPDIFKPLAQAQGKALDELRLRDDVKWTFISPAGDFRADGERTGKYILAGEELTLNSKGESVISYADYAIAFVDEITKGNHIKQRISVVEE